MIVSCMFSLQKSIAAELFCNHAKPKALATSLLMNHFKVQSFACIFEDGDSIMVCVWIVPQNDRERHNKYTVRINPYSTPDDLVYEVIRKRLVPQGE